MEERTRSNWVWKEFIIGPLELLLSHQAFNRTLPSIKSLTFSSLGYCVSCFCSTERSEAEKSKELTAGGWFDTRYLRGDLIYDDTLLLGGVEKELSGSFFPKTCF